MPNDTSKTCRECAGNDAGFYHQGDPLCRECRRTRTREVREQAIANGARKVAPGWEMECAQCGVTFRAKDPRLTCSRACKDIKRRNAALIDVACDVCASPLPPKLGGEITRLRTKGNRMLCGACRNAELRSPALPSGLVLCRGAWCSYGGNGTAVPASSFGTTRRGTRESYCRTCTTVLYRVRAHKQYMDAEGFVAALYDQDFRCASGCGYQLAVIDKSTMIDHCHVTNTFRGLLCSACNFAIGHARDDTRILRALASYLERKAGAAEATPAS